MLTKTNQNTEEVADMFNSVEDDSMFLENCYNEQPLVENSTFFVDQEELDRSSRDQSSCHNKDLW
jgi:hypothetical protein